MNQSKNVAFAIAVVIFLSIAVAIQYQSKEEMKGKHENNVKDLENELENMRLSANSQKGNAITKTKLRTLAS